MTNLPFFFSIFSTHILTKISGQRKRRCQSHSRTSLPPSPSPSPTLHPKLPLALIHLKISHPHFYTTHLEYASAFSCPIYVSSNDSEWLSRADVTGLRIPLVTPVTEIIPGITAIKAGGHFPGSLVLHVKSKSGDALMLADTIMTVPVSKFNFHLNILRLRLRSRLRLMDCSLVYLGRHVRRQ